MRILIVNQFFWPDVAPTGQYLSDLTRHLAAQGHHITVICSKDPYAKAEDNGQPPPPVEVLRVACLPFRGNAISQLLSYVTFFVGAWRKCMKVPRPDMVITMTTPPMLAVIGDFIKSYRKTRHFIWEMDVFPDALVTTGAMRGGAVIRLLSSLQTSARRHSDGIIALGPCMQARLVAGGTPPELVRVAENWADSTTISPLPPPTEGPFHVLYSGNLGRAHDIGTITDAMRYFRNNSRFRFSFAGRGVGREKLSQVCATEQIRNIKFPQYANRSDISAHLAKADIGLVTELPECIGTIVPSKVYALMAAARPILFIGPRAATPGLMIDEFQCGWQVDPGDSAGLIALLEHLADHREEVAFRGAQALKAFRQHYDLPQGVARVAAALGLGDPVPPKRERVTSPDTPEASELKSAAFR